MNVGVCAYTCTHVHTHEHCPAVFFFKCKELARGGRAEAYTGFRLGNQKERTLGRPRRRWEDNIKIDIQEVGCGVWTGSSWLRIGKGGGQL